MHLFYQQSKRVLETIYSIIIRITPERKKKIQNRSAHIII
jgi:hypothetical protein